MSNLFGKLFGDADSVGTCVDYREYQPGQKSTEHKTANQGCPCIFVVDAGWLSGVIKHQQPLMAVEADRPLLLEQ